MPEEGGALCLLCLAAGSGLPLFCRTRGGPPRPQLPFSLIGSLHAVHVFGAGAGVALRGAATPTTRLAWGGYGQSITLIALSSAPGPALSRLLDSAFSAMVLVLGLDELVPIRNVERLKRELRSCFGLIDALLVPGGGWGGWGLGPPSRPLPPGPPRDLLQERLERFAGAAQTGLGCLLGGRGRVVLATPHCSPTVPHRLLLLELVPGVGVALLCGPLPPLQLICTQLVPRFWGPVLEQLRGCAHPPPEPLPPGVLAYLLIHRQHGRTQSGVVTGGAQDGVLPPQRRGAALRHLYALVAPQYCAEGGGGAPGAGLCYAALPTHTGCALLRPDLLLLLLLPPRAPRPRLRPLALRVLRALRPP
ncbi:protein fuzzy [Grus japonensis]|uniref:Protein fuzzy n=1 Tax=Grus japonensis TaxID=30415 RepID=A0ABC9XZ41_GRUJA